MGKTRFAPHTQRFADVPRVPALYAAELSIDGDPFVKVGAASNAQGRMMSLQNEAKRHHDAALVRFHILPKRTPKAAYEAETRAVKRLEQIASPIEGRREFFIGVSFETAVQVLDEAANSGLPNRNPSTPQLAVAGASLVVGGEVLCSDQVLMSHAPIFFPSADNQR